MQTNHNYKKTNAYVSTRGYWEALNKLMSITAMPVDDKVRLVRFKKEIAEHIQDLAEVIKGMEADKIAELMKKEYSAEVKPVDVDMTVLSADELYQLEGLVNLEV